MNKNKDNVVILISELRDYFDVDIHRQDFAEGLIRSTERDLGRNISDLEARVVLANSGHFPEITDDLRRRVISVGGEEINKGILMRKPEKIGFGHAILEAVILGVRKTKEGD
jgi:hypothetical protein